MLVAIESHISSHELMKCVNISGDDYSNDELEMLEHCYFSVYIKTS